MDYGQLLKRAGEITWRYKFLWIFGFIMALCGQGSGGRPNFQTNYSYRTSTPLDLESGFPEFPAFFPEPLGQTPIIVYVVIGLALMILFFVVGLVVGAIGRSALIKSVDRVEEGERVSFSSSWQDGLAKALPVGILQAILFSPLLLLMAVAIVFFLTQFYPFFAQIFEDLPHLDSQQPPVFMEDFFTLFPLFFSAICVFICLGFIIQILAGLFLIFGSRAIVLEDRGVWTSFSRSWGLFRHNIGPTIILALIIMVIAMGVSFALALPTMAIMLPVMVSIMPQMLSETGPPIGTYLLLGILGLIVSLFYGFVSGIFQVFIEAIWTLAYREFAAE
jgi:hypothetical protein